MSWLSSLFGGSDDSAAILAQAQAQEQARRVAAQQQADRDAEEARLANERRVLASQGARANAMSYFSERGLDPNAYGGDIDAYIQNQLGTVNPNDPTPGAYLQNVGQAVYENKRNAARDTALRGINTAFTPDFETSRIANTLDDPFIAETAASQKQKGEDYITNLFKRGVITETGRAGAEKALTDQDARVRTQLSDIGSDLLAGGRQSLTDIANRGRLAASSIDLGNAFDPSKYTTEADTAYNEFLGSLGDKFKSAVPSDLYDLSGLSSAAGVSQGAQNTAFDPAALAGILSSDQKPKEEDPTGTGKKTLF